jgi:hypothetical protein
LVHSKKKANNTHLLGGFDASKRKPSNRQLTQWKHIVRKHSENMKTTQFPAPATGGRKEFEHEGNALQVTTSNTQQFWDTNTFQSHKGHLLYLGTSRNLKGQYMSVYSTNFWLVVLTKNIPDESKAENSGFPHWLANAHQTNYVCWYCYYICIIVLEWYWPIASETGIPPSMGLLEAALSSKLWLSSMPTASTSWSGP